MSETQSTIGEQADGYESPKTKNIADLRKVSVDEVVIKKTFKQDTPEEFSVRVLVRDGEDYRVPDSVLKDLKVLREDNPELKFFKVKRSGEGFKTTYTTIPLTE